MPDHISKQFDMELENIRTRVLQMGGLVEQQIRAAMEALQEGDMDRLERVIAEDAKVNAFEVSIDEDCQHIIARRQPAASDLRMVITVIKTITDLERIGDEAQKIARVGRSMYKSARHPTPRFREADKMAKSALVMLHRALDSFARLDPTAAVELAEEDIMLDEDYASELRAQITYMMEDPRTITQAIDTLFICKAIERIGDHAKNISEYVVYLVKGKDIRHTTLEDKKRETMPQDPA